MISGESAPTKPRRTADVGRKLIAGYLPFTLLVLVPLWGLVFIVSASGPGAMGGSVVLVIWSVQICISNLWILLFRWTSKAAVRKKSLVVTLFSFALLPLLLVLYEEYQRLRIGKPDLAAHLELTNVDQCKIRAQPRLLRVNNTTYNVLAKVECGSAGATKSCKWYFEFDESRQTWFSPNAPTCNPLQ